MVDINIDKEKCTGCSTCVDVCPVGIYEMNDEKATVSGNLDDCVVCRACDTSCPSGAIEVVE